MSKKKTRQILYTYLYHCLNDVNLGDYIPSNATNEKERELLFLVRDEIQAQFYEKSERVKEKQS